MILNNKSINKTKHIKTIKKSNQLETKFATDIKTDITIDIDKITRNGAKLIFLLKREDRSKIVVQTNTSIKFIIGVKNLL